MSLTGQTLKIKAASSAGHIATLAVGGHPFAVALAPAAEYTRVVNVLPSSRDGRLVLGAPFDRQLTLVSAPDAPVAAAGMFVFLYFKALF